MQQHTPDHITTQLANSVLDSNSPPTTSHTTHPISLQQTHLSL